MDLPVEVRPGSKSRHVLARAGLYVRTVRHLRAAQILRRATRALSFVRPDAAPPPPLRPRDRLWQPAAHHEPCLSGPGRARFLNEERSIESASAWTSPDCSRLWLYNLHYFNDLTAAKSPTRERWHQALIARWIRESPPGKGPGWEPYPTSLRIVNWIKWAVGGAVLSDAAVHSLAIQARWLRRHLEWHLLGNHLLANAKALIYAGVFFAGPEAEGWLRTGLRILARELNEQVLPDGGHFERSPMYHSIVLEDLLDLANLRCAYGDRPGDPFYELCARIRAIVPEMLWWLSAMCHPDGDISFFNDTAFGIAARPADLSAYAQRLGFRAMPAPAAGVTHLAASGYIRLQRGPAVVILDVGEIGPDYIPGHAHADTLSYELSLFGKRVAVNSGTSTYTPGPQRSYERSTAAHNTVEVNGEDSSEVWGAFRVARRARPLGLLVDDRGDGLHIACRHDGYRRAGCRAIHAREWILESDRLVVADRVAGRCRQAVGRIHFHPSITPRIPPGAAETPGLECDIEGPRVRLSMSAPLTLVRTEYHPEFGVTVPRVCARTEIQRELCAQWSWDRP